MKRTLLIFIIISSFAAQGQVMLGIANSNFAGNMGMNLNPTAMLLMPYKWEVNLISGDIFVDNNYIRYPKARVMGSVEGTTDVPHGGLLDTYNSNPKNAHSHTHLRLPSFLYRTREQAFGISFTVRSDVSVRNVSPNLAKYLYEGLEYTELSGVPIEVDPFRIAGMTWAEIGLSYGRIIDKGHNQLLVAGTLNLIGAFQGLYFYNYNTADLTVTGDTVMTMTVNNLDAELAFDLPRDQSEMLQGRGKGASMNIGFTYVSNPYRGNFKDARTPTRKRYDYRFGVSIMDAGMVFFDRNAHVYTFNSSNTTIDSVNTISPAGVDGLDQFILDEFVTANSSIDNSFFLMPPLAVSTQLDVCLAPRWYANATIVQRANPPMPHVDFPNIVSITPRYETSYFEIAMPYSLYDYYLMRIGIAMRYRFLVLGTDKLGPYVTNNDVTGMDFYFGLKFSDYDFMRKGKRGRSKALCDAYN